MQKHKTKITQLIQHIHNKKPIHSTNFKHPHKNTNN